MPLSKTLPKLYMCFVIMLAASGNALAVDGVSSSEVTVAIVNTTSGPTATTGIMFNAGPKVYFDKINKAGGINGRKINARVYDDGYEPIRAAAETKKAIEVDKVFAVINNNGTPTAKAVMPIIQRLHVPFLFPRTGDVAVREPFDHYVFHLRSSFAIEMNKLIEYVVGTQHKKKIAVLSQSDVFGTVVKSYALKALRLNGIKSFIGEGEVPRNSVDITEPLDVIAKSDPDVVVLGVTQAAAVPFLKAAQKLGKKWIYVALNNNNPIANQLTNGEADNVFVSQVTPNPVTSELAIAKMFREDMKAAGQEQSINFVAFEGYLNAHFFAEALKEAGSSPTREKLIEAFEAKEFDLGGIKVKYTNKDHEANLPVFLTRIKGQNFNDI
jgi:branched-chain amino acid transport system substrate-binding protein